MRRGEETPSRYFGGGWIFRRLAGQQKLKAWGACPKITAGWGPAKYFSSFSKAIAVNQVANRLRIFVARRKLPASQFRGCPEPSETITKRYFWARPW